jgi:hypothetical protein
VALINNDRISHWYLGCLLAWAVCFLFLGIPIFHLGFGSSISKIAISLAICCGAQLAITPWLYSARATPQNPNGFVGRRTAAVFVWCSLTALFLFYYIQRGWPSSQAAQQARIIMSVGLVVFLVILGVILCYNLKFITSMGERFRKKARVPQAIDDSHPIE